MASHANASSQLIRKQLFLLCLINGKHSVIISITRTGFNNFNIKRLTEHRISRIESDLIFRGITNEPFCVSESHVTRSGSISLIVGNDFDFAVLKDTNTRVGSTKIDSNGWGRHVWVRKTQEKNYFTTPPVPWVCENYAKTHVLHLVL